jgi:putative flippase GtrA
MTAVGEQWVGDWGVRVRYFAQSLAGLGVGLALLTLWVEWGGLRPWAAALVNFAVLGVVQCAIADRWVFGGGHATTLRGFARRFAGYQVAMLSSKGLNYVVFVALVEAGLVYQVAWLAGAALSFGVSLALNRQWFARV